MACFARHYRRASSGERRVRQNPPVLLLVEDEWLICSVIASYLRSNGWEVLEASSGEEAFSYLEKNATRVDVLFTDIRLGGRLTGWDVADAFRASYPEIGVVYASGNAIEPSRVVPGATFFPKPYAPEVILTACKDRLRYRQRIFAETVCLKSEDAPDDAAADK